MQRVVTVEGLTTLLLRTQPQQLPTLRTPLGPVPWQSLQLSGVSGGTLSPVLPGVPVTVGHCLEAQVTGDALLVPFAAPDALLVTFAAPDARLVTLAAPDALLVPLAAPDALPVTLAAQDPGTAGD